MAVSKLEVAVAGLGRMGKRRAVRLLARKPRAELVGAFAPDAPELALGRTCLESFGIRLFMDYDKILEIEGLQIVYIATITTVHAKEAIKAVEKDLHVLCEKPLSMSAEIVSFLSR
jgi:predicted dehydrogenase